MFRAFRVSTPGGQRSASTSNGASAFLVCRVVRIITCPESDWLLRWIDAIRRLVNNHKSKPHRQCHLRLSLALLLTAASALAYPADSSKLAEIAVTGSTRFQTPELVTATGLKVGQDATEDTLKKAADRLASTGMFTEVGYSYTSNPQGMRVEYQVHDAAKLLPADFDNFVWMSQADLLKKLEERQPLFHGEVPAAGDMYKYLAEDMKAILSQMGVAVSEVSALPEAPQTGGDIFGFVYRVEGVKLPIRTIELTGVSPGLQAVIQKTANDALLGQDYSRSRLASASRLDLLPQYKMRGYLRAAIGTPAASLVDRSTGSVDVTLPVTEGATYRLAGIEWSGNTVFPASDFGKVIKAKSAEPLNQLELEDNLGAISKIYGTKGYIDAWLKPGYRFDDVAKAVTVDVKVQEGDQYRMGKVSFEGLTASASASLSKLWKLNSGEVYDSSYPGLFLQTASRQFKLDSVQIDVHQTPHKESKTVDVTIVFKPN